MNAVGAVSDRVIQTFQDLWKDSLLSKVWDAVVDFFKTVAAAIVNGCQAIYNFMKEAFCETPISYEVGMENVNVEPAGVEPPAPADLQEKLALYNNMPARGVDLVARAIDIYEATLKGKEAGIAEEERPSRKFIDSFEAFDGGSFVQVAYAIVRAYTFSKSGTDQDFFAISEKVPDGPPLGQIIDPRNGRVIHAGGQQHRERIVDKSGRLRELRAIFRALPPNEKQMILDKTDFEDIGQMEISENGKLILRELAELANRLVQKNVPLMDAIQAAHRRKFAA